MAVTPDARDYIYQADYDDSGGASAVAGGQAPLDGVIKGDQGMGEGE